MIYRNTTNTVDNQRNVTNVFQRAQMLEASLQQLKRENKSLREKLEMMELNMSSFIREMGGMMDQHDLSGALTDMLNEETILNSNGSGLGRNNEEGGGSTGGSIRKLTK